MKKKSVFSAAAADSVGKMRLFWVIACIVFITKIEAAKILAYFPTPSISHQLPFRPLTQELARRGHEVVVITTDPAFPKGETPANLTEIDIHDISYYYMRKYFVVSKKGDRKDFSQQIYGMFALLKVIIDAQLNTTHVKNAIYGQKYDLLIIEACMRSALGLSHVHKVPVILISSLGAVFGVKEAIGAPTHPMLYHDPMRQRLYNLTLWEKAEELYNYFKLLRLYHSTEEAENKMLKRHFGDDMPPLSELYNNVDMLFLNTHPIFEGNHPVPPGVVYIWGIHNKPQKNLPEDLKTFLDSSKHGVIYMSFGTNTDPTLLPKEKIQNFVKVFCKLPYDVLWKWNEDDLPGQCENIKIGKWFPQSDLLRHPNIKLFITQGGLQSTDEAITAIVPLVGIPMLGDQWYNVEKYVHFGIGVKLDFETLTEKNFEDAVTTVISDESYRANIRRLDGLMRDEPSGALRRAVWWVEHVLRHGGARHLRAPAANISWAHYLELELLFTLLGGLLLSLIIIRYLYQVIKKSFFNNSVKLKEN